MKHHYVPQFLLRRWTDDRGRLFSFSVRNGALVCSRRTPKSTGYESGLYAIVANVFGLSEDHIEKKLFGPIDNAAAVALEKIENHEALAGDDHVAWTFFLSSLRIRQPDTLEFLRTKGMALLVAKLAEIDAANPPPGDQTTADWYEQHFPGGLEAASLASWLPRMIALDTVTDAFAGLDWRIREFGPDMPGLLLSDMPLHSENPLADPDFFITLPIAPNRLFMGTRSPETHAVLSQMPAADLIANVNRTTLALSSNRIWAATRGDSHEFIEANIDAVGVNVIRFDDLAPWSENGAIMHS